MSGGPKLRIERLINPRFASNTYFLSCEGAGGVVIDPGENVENWLMERVGEGGGMDYILLTHEHFDHCGGVPAVRARWPAPLICSRDCSAAIVDPTRNFSRYLIQRDITCPPADRYCEDLKGELAWGGRRFQFVVTPGHSPGSICIGVDDALFTGDTLLPDLKGVTRLPGGDKRALAASVERLIAMFGSDTVIYPGHGDPFRLGSATMPTGKPGIEPREHH